VGEARMQNVLYVKGAREHNLKNIDIKIPRDQFVVITGLSGSGKSSLAFDTIYAEGQRRYVESLSSYARQFLGQMEKPDVDYIEGLSPSISIDQKTTAKNPRSTVGTVTEIYDYLRLLFARIGQPHCVQCGKAVSMQTVDQMVDAIMALPAQTKVQVLAPVVRGRKGEHQKLLEDARKSGYVRVRVDGTILEIEDKVVMDKNKKHTIEIVVDRLIVKEGIQKRLTDSIETVLSLTDGMVLLLLEDRELIFSQKYACVDCNINMEELTPRMFSFNNPYGACPGCSGLGKLQKIDPDRVVPDASKSLKEGAIAVSGWNIGNEESYSRMYLLALSKAYAFSMDTPFQKLSKEVQDIIFYGTGDQKIHVQYEKQYGSGTFFSSFEGIIHSMERRYKVAASESVKRYYEEFMASTNCPTCIGARLKKESLAVSVQNKNIYQLCTMPVGELRYFFEKISLSQRDLAISNQIIKEIRARTSFLVNVGLDYLTLAREAGTLSGGEAQRIRLATQIGSGLTGVLYILDEPSIGLHQRDNHRLLETLTRLKDLGNTLIVVEHDEDTMIFADHVIDMGPGAGVHGGEVIAQGTLSDIMKNPRSVTGNYLKGERKIEVPKRRRQKGDRWLKIFGACENNLKNIDFSIPVGLFTCVTGVSGSGKSSLVNGILHKALARELHGVRTSVGQFDRIEGLEHIDKVIDIDQSPIGRTPRSNPATYTGLFDFVRDVFEQTIDAKTRGYKKGRFSFNVKGGRCEACAGDGIIKIEMHFLPDVYIPCEVCKGKRYNRETLEIQYKGKNIAQVLDMTVEDAMEFFKNIPKIKRKLETLSDVGLGYIKLGQSSTTLSGGEAQRVKLATELSKKSTGKTFYILDEPTTGLHIADVHKLIDILQRLADGGNTVVVIEHNLHMIKVCDHILDLGPEGGNKGGHILAEGTPEEVAAVDESYTGKFLADLLA
jgi:excinuclease ABC subunit A